MHLSRKELLSNANEYCGDEAKFVRFEEALLRSGPVVYSDDRAAEEGVSGCPTCGRTEGAAQLRTEVGRRAQWVADRALWSAAEPVPVPDTSGYPNS